MKAWQKYQHETADLLREMGFVVVVDDTLKEPNGTEHAVDVSARRTVGGVELLWVVECKKWKKRVTKEKVAALKAIVDWVGADRGLAMSESGFQSGAIRMAEQKNITLSSLEDLRARAGEELMAARITEVERRVLNVTQKVIRDLRVFSTGTPHILPIMASRLSPDDWTELTALDEAPDFLPGVGDIIHRTGTQGIGDFMQPGTDVSGVRRKWKDGVDEAVMDKVSGEIGPMSQALDQGKLDNWPIVFIAATGAKLAWDMRQLLRVIESKLTVLEQVVAEQEYNAAG